MDESPATVEVLDATEEVESGAAPLELGAAVEDGAELDPVVGVDATTVPVAVEPEEIGVPVMVEGPEATEEVDAEAEPVELGAAVEDGAELDPVVGVDATTVPVAVEPEEIGVPVTVEGPEATEEVDTEAEPVELGAAVEGGAELDPVVGVDATTVPVAVEPEEIGVPVTVEGPEATEEVDTEAEPVELGAAVEGGAELDPVVGVDATTVPVAVEPEEIGVPVTVEGPEATEEVDTEAEPVELGAAVEGGAELESAVGTDATGVSEVLELSTVPLVPAVELAGGAPAGAEFIEARPALLVPEELCLTGLLGAAGMSFFVAVGRGIPQPLINKKVGNMNAASTRVIFMCRRPHNGDRRHLVGVKGSYHQRVRTCG